MSPRRIPSRVAALVDMAPLDVLEATAGRAGERPPAPLERALRTGAAVAAVPEGWHWPRWLDRQLRPGHPAQVPVGDLGAVENVTGRDWCTVGTVSSGPLALVDPRGLVTPVEGGWSLDWLVLAGDRWHRPARDAGIRQRHLGSAPVLETSCRVAGGDAVQRVYGITAGGGLGDVVLVEVENASPTPFAVAFALRPADLLGAGTIGSLALDDATISLDGRPVVVLDRRPARAAVGDAAIDSLGLLESGADVEGLTGPIRCARGLAQAVVVVPVPHRTTVRLVLRPRATRRDRLVFDPSAAAAPAVVRGWAAHTEHAPRFELPDQRMVDAYRSSLSAVLLAAGGGTLGPPPGRAGRWSVADEARVVRALLQCGQSDAAGAIVRSRCDELGLDGWFRAEPPSLERNDAVFGAVADCWSLARDARTVDEVLAPVVKAAHWSERFRRRVGPSIDGGRAAASHVALRRLASALDGFGQHEAAQDLAAFAARFVLDLETVAAPSGTDGAEHVVHGHAGIDTIATIDGAAASVLRGDEGALGAVTWLGERAGRRSTFVHPRLGTGAGGAGDDPVVAAAIIGLVRSFAVDDRAGVAILPVVPSAWYGHPLEVHDLPTSAGRLSYAVRWHGERPALLWEVDPDGRPPATLTVPGLDAAFRTTEPRGEALLAAPTRVVDEPGASFS